METIESHVMTSEAKYAGRKEYYDYYNYHLECSCGWKETVGSYDSVKHAYQTHKEEVILRKLGLEFYGI